MQTIRSFAKSVSLVLPLVLGMSFIGCGTFGDKNTDEAKKYELQQKIDKGEYEQAYQMLESDCAGYDTTECNMNKGAVLFNQAGFDAIYVIKALSEEDESGESNFISKIAQDVDSAKLALMKEAVEFYAKVSDDCSNKDVLSNIQQTACFNIGMVELTSSVGALNLIGYRSGPLDPEDDVNVNEKYDGSDATVCATKTAKGDACIPSATVASGPTDTDFANSSDSYSFDVYEIQITGTAGGVTNPTYTRLITQGATKTAILTDGYCKVDFTACASVPTTERDLDSATTGCYPCPALDSDGNVLTVTSTIVDSLNSGTDAIIAFLPDSEGDLGDDTSGVNADICEASTPTKCTYDENGDYVVTDEALMDYLAN